MTHTNKQDYIQTLTYNSDCHANIVNLYTWVIAQAFMDYASQSQNRRMQTIKRKASQWILEENEGFNNVCEMANLSPHKVREKFIKLKNNRCNLQSALNFA